MRIFDSAILKLPFFEDKHRALGQALEEWVNANWKLQEALNNDCPIQSGFTLNRLLGEGGWFNEVIGLSGATRPDLRSICLMRQAFSYLHDLLDFAFSIQTLSCSAIEWFGSVELQKQYLNLAKKGKIIGSFALSEASGGSDLASITCQAKLAKGGFTLSGEKSWVSNANIADFCCLLARSGEGPSALGLSMFLVPLTKKDNIVISPVNFIAPRACANLEFKNTSLEAAALIGERGVGFTYAMQILDFYRVSVGATAIGFSRRAFDEAAAWSKKRKIAGGYLFSSQLTQCKFSKMDVQLHSAELFVARAAWEFDISSKGGVPRHASMAKLNATEAAQSIVDESLQLLGAFGLTENSVTSRLYQQVRSLRIYEGTSEVQNMIISSSLSL